jgi:hypothetical protein
VASLLYYDAAGTGDFIEMHDVFLPAALRVFAIAVLVVAAVAVIS